MTNIDISQVLKILGRLLIFLSLAMLAPLAWMAASDWQKFQVDGPISLAFLESITIGMVSGLIIWLIGLRSKKPGKAMGKREALLLVSSAWFVAAFIGALPFWSWAQKASFGLDDDTSFRNFVNCFFESMSGLTTTGATILSNIESIPQGLLFWRSFLHWLGGLGIVVIFVALMPALAGNRKKLFSTETSGIGDSQGKSIQSTSRLLLFVYLLLTILMIGALKIVDPTLSWFHVVVHTFSTIATGGFSSYNTSAAALSPAAQWVLIVFMAAAGVNFALYTGLIFGRVRQFVQNNELRLYCYLILLGTLITALAIHTHPYLLANGQTNVSSAESTVRNALFQVVSIITTTGFCSVDFEGWPIIAQSVLLFLMFVGGCGGSTAGGVKVIRLQSMFKIMAIEFERSYRPKVIRAIKIGPQFLNSSHRSGILTYMCCIIFIILSGSFVLLLFEPRFTGYAAFTASLSAIGNIGPGFESVGATANFGWMNQTSKIILSLFMAVGRLEFYAVAVLFLPGFWKGE